MLQNKEDEFGGYDKGRFTGVYSEVEGKNERPIH
jgi:hypothetical protein